MVGFSRAATIRNLTSPALRAMYNIEVQGSESIPTQGPVIFDVHGVGLLVAPVVNACSTRPIHFIIDGELRVVLSKKTRYLGGDIPLEMPGFAATQVARKFLGQSEAVGLMGSFPSLGHLVAATGAQVVPVSVLGAGGKVPTDPPRPRSTISILFHAPIEISPVGDPCALATVQTVGEQVRQARADARTQI